VNTRSGVNLFSTLVGAPTAPHLLLARTQVDGTIPDRDGCMRAPTPIPNLPCGIRRPAQEKSRMRKLASAAVAASLSILTFAPVVSGPAAAAAPTSHVAWCEATYRSYNPATDTFIGNDGYAHACVSPAQTTLGSAAPFPFLAAGAQGAAGPGHAYSVFPDEDDSSYGYGLDNADH
jgi:hypothetical protein